MKTPELYKRVIKNTEGEYQVEYRMITKSSSNCTLRLPDDYKISLASKIKNKIKFKFFLFVIGFSLMILFIIKWIH